MVFGNIDADSSIIVSALISEENIVRYLIKPHVMQTYEGVKV
jgi:hypothetical protein